MENGACDHVPYEAGNRLRQQMKGNGQGRQLLYFLHEESEPEDGGCEGHEAEQGHDVELSRRELEASNLDLRA